ncbi:hypothetical protein ACSBR1_004968 [Camellia fascicularis]
MAVIPPEIRYDRRYWPWFKDCVRAIDGTHIAAVAREVDQMPYRGRKVNTTQNVMAACSFDMEFTFEYTGWEESSEEDEDEGEGEGEGGVENVNENEDGVPEPQQQNHVNMSREQLL